MTITEFKIWLQGFEVGLGGNALTAEQLAAFKAKVESITIDTPAS